MVEADYFNSVITTDGGYVAVGYSNSTTIATNGDKDAVIVKFDEAGNKLWNNNYGGSNSDNFNSVIKINNGYVVVGYSNSSRIGQLANTGKNNAIIVKYNTLFDIIKDDETNGTFSIDKESATYESIITITSVTPSNGYQLKEIKILNASDDSDITTAVSYNSTNKTFTMPDYAVKISIEFEEMPIMIENPQTSDKILSSILLGAISLLGICGCNLLLNKNRRI